jgi:hypothetical protein
MEYLMRVEKIAYGGWLNCYRLANDQVELVVTADVGPRVIRFGFTGEVNEFTEVPEQLGQVGGSDWRLYGGHRLWNAPESLERTYIPDNQPPEVMEIAGGFSLCQPVEAETGIQKEMAIRLAPDKNHVTITHRLRNCNPFEIDLAPWAVTVMASGGTAILPLPPRGAHDENLLPTGRLILWAYTDMTDPRWTWGRQYILLRQDVSVPLSQKLGIANTEGWVGYANHGNLFVKTAAYLPDSTYPDLGSSTEIYTNGGMLEVETLAPVMRVPSNGSVEHVENWYLFRGVPQPRSDEDVDRTVLPLVQSIR